MAGQKVFDPDEIRKSINILKPNNELFEIRCLETNGRTVHSGYFHDADTAINCLCRMSLSIGNVYITLNRIKESCYSREQRDRFIQNVKVQTSDTDIEGYEFLFVDVDPNRPAGISSSNSQLEAAKAKGNKVYAFMRKMGFNEPITALSGNGIHLLYRIQLLNTDENKALVKKCLAVLDMLFSDDEEKIDTTNFNPARICKLYGTMARKGSNTEQNPHRMSRMISEGSKEPNDRVYLEKLAAMLPVEEKPQKYNNYRRGILTLKSG